MKTRSSTLLLSLSLTLSAVGPALLLGCGEGSGTGEVHQASSPPGEILASDPDREIRALTTDGVDVFWLGVDPSQPGATLRKVSTVGGEPITLAAFEVAPGDQRMAFDREAIYLTAGERALRVPRDGGPPLVLARTSAAEVAVADGHVYWAQAAVAPDLSPSKVAVEVKRVPVTGGDVAIVGSLVSSSKPRGIVADGRDVYVRTDAEVLTVPSNGGTLVPMTGVRVDAFALDAEALYVGGAVGGVTGLFRAARDGASPVKLTDVDPALSSHGRRDLRLRELDIGHR